MIDPLVAQRLLEDFAHHRQRAAGALAHPMSHRCLYARSNSCSSHMPSVTPKPENVAPLVILVRGERVLLSQHLAELYGVSVSALNQAVKRNMRRFPGDFMFQLSREEFERLKSQIVISKSQSNAISQSESAGRGGLRRALPYAFTEQGVAMLSSVLRSPRAVEVNIAIMRPFVQLRRLMDSNRNLARKIESMEKKYDEQFAVVFDAIKRLIEDDEGRKTQPRRRIGFIP